jgi:hypothetical protein
MSEYPGFNGFSGNTTIARNLDSRDNILLPNRQGAKQEKSQEKAQQRTVPGITTS